MLSILLETIGALGILLSIAVHLGRWRGSTGATSSPRTLQERARRHVRHLSKGERERCRGGKTERRRHLRDRRSSCQPIDRPHDARPLAPDLERQARFSLEHATDRAHRGRRA